MSYADQRNGIDCASTLVRDAVAYFISKGVTKFGRYLVPEEWGWKALKDAEVEIVTELGGEILSVFERSGGRPLKGYEAGVEDGAIAMDTAHKRRQPEGTGIIFAVDFEPKDLDFGTILDYFRGVNASLKGYEVGGYGNAKILRALSDAGLITQLWQTVAWSYHELLDGIHMFQYEIDKSEAGIGVDNNVCYDGLLSWNLNTPARTKPQPITAFSDVEAGHWSESYIKKVSDAGIMTGYADGTFAPAKAVTREELATVANHVIYIFQQNGVSQMSETNGATTFPDVESGRWSEGAIGVVAKLGVMNGYEDGAFRPANPVTREELAKVIATLLKL